MSSICTLILVSAIMVVNNYDIKVNNFTTVIDASGNLKIFDFPADNRLDVTNAGHTVKYEFNDDRLITRIDFPEGNYVTYEYYPAIGSNKHPAGNLHFLRQFPAPAGGDTLVARH